MIPNCLHSSHMNFGANRGSQSLMIFDGSLKHEKMCLRYSPAVSLAMISSLQGMNTAISVQSWSVMVKIESLPCDSGSFVIKSRAIVSNGSASGFG